ncbi:MAG TPA: 50S ribosomal protein L10 [Sumerlaeia bacterium]|nr:50S ribosomal protein L10 [Sumerlaeia bacterium]
MVQPLKIEVVRQTTDRLRRADSVVVVNYQGLTVAQMQTLRKQLREAGGELKVLKNRLTKRALQDAECDPLDDVLAGPTALAFGYDDPTGPARVCSKFAEGNATLSILGGLLEKRRVGLDKIVALAKLPGRAELLTQMARTMLAPARQMATALHQAMAKIAYAMQARADLMES